MTSIHSRRAEVEITYEGVNITKDIAPFLLSFRYVDNGNSKADEVSITLHDRDGNWRYKWMPVEGDKIKAELVLYHWEQQDKHKRMPCGTFYIDNVNYDGPPDIMTVSAVSYPIAGGLKREKKTKAWEKVTLKTIANSIAKSAGLKLLFDMSDVKYDRIDQTEQSDIAFIASLAEKESATVKVTNDSIVIYDDLKYESTAPVRNIERGVSNIKRHSFQRSYDGVAYAKCSVSYTKTVKKKEQTITGTFTIPGKTGPTLKLQERVESTAEAVRRARNELRNRNKQAHQASFTVVGDPKLVQGATIEVLKYSNYNGKYFIESATHSILSTGYETSIQCRRVLTF